MKHRLANVRLIRVSVTQWPSVEALFYGMIAPYLLAQAAMGALMLALVNP